MGDLDELIERLTVKFDKPIKSRELKLFLFPYLSISIPCRIDYSFRTRGQTTFGETEEDKKHPSEFKAEIIRLDKEMIHSNLDLEVDIQGNFHYIKFDELVPGYNTVEEFETLLPTGKEKLRLADDVRVAVNRYFSSFRPLFKQD